MNWYSVHATENDIELEISSTPTYVRQYVGLVKAGNKATYTANFVSHSCRPAAIAGLPKIVNHSEFVKLHNVYKVSVPFIHWSCAFCLWVLWLQIPIFIAHNNIFIAHE